MTHDTHITVNLTPKLRRLSNILISYGANRKYVRTFSYVCNEIYIRKDENLHTDENKFIY
jgi:hypothetical protein